MDWGRRLTVGFLLDTNQCVTFAHSSPSSSMPSAHEDSFRSFIVLNLSPEIQGPISFHTKMGETEERVSILAMGTQLWVEKPQIQPPC